MSTKTTGGLPRRTFLGLGLAPALLPSMPLGSHDRRRPQTAPSRKNPLGSRWPSPSDRYFYGRAADRREMMAIHERIEPGDVEGYDAAWTRVATDHEARAARTAARGRRVTARNHELRASNYHSQVQNLSLRMGDERRLRAAQARMASAFRRAWDHTPPPFEAIRIPFGDTTLPGVFFEAQGIRGSRGPVVIELSGIDHIKERAFFRSHWIPYVERGLHYVTFDGPGQGELLASGVYLRPDSEVAARAALDYLTTRPDIDPERIGVFGTSFGGYFAPRIAASDPRVKALACRSAVFDAVEDAFDFCPMIREQLRLLVNARSLDEARQRLAPFTLRDIAGQIRCPAFIAHGSRDDIVSVAAARKLAEALPGRSTTLLIVEGAGHHPGAAAETEQLDWLVERLQPGGSLRRRAQDPPTETAGRLRQ